METAVGPDELESWLRDSIRAQIASTNKAIEKTRADTEAQISSLKEIVLDLTEKSEKDSSEKKNDRAVYKSARAVTRMCLELQDLLTIHAPVDPHSYDGLRQFSDTTTRLSGDAARIRERWIGQVRPYYILDMMSLNASIDKLRRLGEQTWELFSKDGNLLRQIEEIHSRADKIRDLEESLRKAVAECKRVSDDYERIRPQIADAEREIGLLAANRKITELRKIDSRMRELRGDLLASGFRRLGRPLRKLEAMAGRGEFPMSPEIRDRLSEYLSRPFTTFIREDDGYPYLKSIHRSMRQAIEQKKLLLKQREERKVLERITNVAERNSLDEIHHEATKLLSERKGYLEDPKCLELVRAYRQKKQDLKSIRTEEADVERRSKLLSEKTETLRDSLAQFTRDTEQLVEKLTKKPMKITVEQS